MWTSLQVDEWLDSLGVGLEDANQIIQDLTESLHVK